ncbi:MAG: DUF4136 domain-containing protein [Thiohalomonadales bacterium]|nr:DUF4136 domain-containing protein [Thiohalomonadales bacterium]
MLKRYLFILSGVVLLAACATSVNVDYDKQTNFQALKTFKLMPSPETKTGDTRLDSPLVDKRIRDAIVATLSLRGYQQVKDNPDFDVAYQLGLRQEIDSSRSSMTVGIGGFYPHSAIGMTYGYPGYVESYERGILTIDVLHASDKKLIWRGSSGRRLYDGSTPEKSDKEINAVVEEILDKFPPGK